MRVALVGPELEENLALRYIHAAVERAGHEAKIFDFHADEQVLALAAEIDQYGPDVIGLSMVFTARATEFIRLAKQLRAVGYDGHVTAGGHFATFHATELLRDYSAIDSIIHGEGEQGLIELLENLDRPQCVKGLSYRAADGEIRCTGTRENPPDLNALPWPTRPDCFHEYLGLPIANMLSSRGCFANCSFCSINAWHRHNGGRRFRQRGIADVADEMAELYHGRGVRIFNFHDDNFFLPTRAANLRRATALKRRLAERRVGRIGFQVKARPDSVDREVMSLLCEIGLFRVFLGVETNSVAGLVTLNRGLDRQQNYRALKILKRRGVHTCFNLLMFDPETRGEDFRQNIEFMREQCEWPLNFCRTEIYAGTELERRLRAEGRLEGNYLGYAYRIRDRRVQLAYEMFRNVFTPRNFTAEGLNHQAMKLDYYLHILRHFWPRRVDRSLVRRAKCLTARLNRNSADLLEDIDRLAFRDRLPVEAEVQRLVERCFMQRAQCDAQLASEMQIVLADIRQRAARRQRGDGRGGMLAKAASVAAAAVIAVSSGCFQHDDTHMTEMAPAPKEPDRSPIPDGPAVPEPEEYHMCEEAPAAIEPVEDPVEPPTAEPDVDEQAGADRRGNLLGLGWDETGRVEQEIRSHHRADLESVAGRYLDNGASLRVALEFDDKGTVSKYRIESPARASALETDLREVLAAWSFPFLCRGGLCTLTVTMAADQQPTAPARKAPPDTHPHERVPIPIETHPTEMVAPPIDPVPIKPPVKIEQLPADLVKQIQRQIQEKHWPAIESLAAKHLPEDQRQKLPAADLLVTDKGVVGPLRIHLKHNEHVKFQQELRAEISKWRFPFIKKTGVCTVSLQAPQLPLAQVAEIKKAILARYGGKLVELAALHLPDDRRLQPVAVELELDGTGKVVEHKIQMGDKEHPAYQKALGELISSWQFKFVKKPGRCTVNVDPLQVLIRPHKIPDIHMYEMAPAPIRPPRRP